MKTPKVFISYSHDSPAHEDRVLELADKLTETGIDCMIDRYDPAPSSGWPLWMEKQITAADYVLMVCTETYDKRVHQKEKPGKGLGVCWEANLIYNLLSEEKLENNKFIPILFDQYDKKYIPLPLRGYAFYPVDTEKGFEALYRRLTDQPLVVRPKPGSIKKLPSRQRRANPEETDTSPELPLGCVHNLPLFNQTHHFGREEFLTQLHRIFTNDNTATLTQAITGLGGVGKTQIALAYAYTYKKNYRHIWWVRAENPTTCDLDYQDFARRMDLCGPDADRLEISARVREWQEQNGDWLFIYDNAMEYIVLQDYLPRFPGGHMLITTRNHHFEIGNPLPVDVFTPETAGEFLCFRTKRDEPDSGLALGRELGGLPLALEQAAAYIENNHLTLQAYLDLFRRNKLRLFTKSQPPTNYQFTVATTWQISLEKITGEATRQLLYLSAFLDPDRIKKELFHDGAAVLPQPLAETVTDEVIFNEMLTELDTYSLIRRKDDELWSIHRLLQEVVRESLNQERAGWANSVMELLRQVYNFDYYQLKTWEKSGQLISHMQAAVEIAVSLQIENEQFGWICSQIGYYLDKQGRYEEAEPLYKQALGIRERVLGPDHPDTAGSLNNLALLYNNQGRYEEAEPLYKRALEILIKTLGKEHPNTQTCLKNLAMLSKNQKAVVPKMIRKFAKWFNFSTTAQLAP
jgi:tetratricopeptide (TPR) repeat protein